MMLPVRASLLTVGLILAQAPRAETFSLTTGQPTGGGGSSSGGPYAVDGTVGVVDAGVSAHVPYLMTLGFWAPDDKPLDLPALAIIVSPQVNQITIAWNPAAVDFVLQETDSLSGDQTNWVTAGNTNPAIISARAGTKFFRLIKR